MTDEMRKYVAKFIADNQITLNPQQTTKLETLLADQDGQVKTYAVLKQQLRALLKP